LDDLDPQSDPQGLLALIVMTTTTEPRRRGSIRRMRGDWQVRVSAGKDPSTGERIVLTETVQVEKPGDEKSEKAARTEAERLRTRLLADADDLKVARTKSTMGALLDRWMSQHEIEMTTRDTYDSLIRNHIRPALEDVPLLLLMRDATERLERFYAELRRCKRRCKRPFVEHRTTDEHDCVRRKCREHICAPLAVSSVRQIHAIIHSALNAAARWKWIPYNPAANVKMPNRPKPKPNPPSNANMAAIIEEGWRRDPEFGLYLWLSAVIGSRRGEGLGIRYDNIDLDSGHLWIQENWVWTSAGLLLKDTKTHQQRKVSLDPVTIGLLRAHKAESEKRLQDLGLTLTGREFVFSAEPDLSRPRDPSSMSRRFHRIVTKLGINTELKQLRHYSATELLTAGVDLRTVAGRLGHGDGATTLRYYVAWVGAADEDAAKTMASRMPAPPRAITGSESGSSSSPTVDPVRNAPASPRRRRRTAPQLPRGVIVAGRSRLGKRPVSSGTRLAPERQD
jgi:integrase